MKDERLQQVMSLLEKEASHLLAVSDRLFKGEDIMTVDSLSDYWKNLRE